MKIYHYHYENKVSGIITDKYFSNHIKAQNDFKIDFEIAKYLDELNFHFLPTPENEFLIVYKDDYNFYIWGKIYELEVIE